MPEDQGNKAVTAKWAVPAIETVIAAVVVAVILVALACAGQQYETNWILIAILPVAFWLFFSGRISTFKAFGVELTAAIRQASKETISDRDIALRGSEELTLVRDDSKADIALIREYVRRRVPALSFELGRTDYYTTEGVHEYLERLCQQGFFRWVVFRHKNGQFAGLVPAANLKVFAPDQYHLLIFQIEEGDVGDLPGIVGPELALRVTDTKGEAIERFAKTDHADLPVVDADNKFVGVLNRGRLQSRLLSSILNAARVGS